MGEIATQSADNVFFQEFIDGASGYAEDNGVIEYESKSEKDDITKRLKELLKTTQNDQIRSVRSADVSSYKIKQKTSAK